VFSRLSKAAAVVGLCAGFIPACTPPADLQISDATVRALVPGRDTTAGYFVVRNNTDATVILQGASSPHARSIEMHRTYVKDDRVGMQRVREQTIEPGQQLEFAPGGLHLMIFGVRDMPEPFPITLLFNDGRQVSVPFSKLPYR
jgi:copper(I)-binding protein